MDGSSDGYRNWWGDIHGSVGKSLSSTVVLCSGCQPSWNGIGYVQRHNVCDNVINDTLWQG